jgi:hypothetical protein
MVYTATQKATGWTNNVKASCMKCRTGNLYVNPTQVKNAGGKWKCPVCGHLNGGG